MTITTNTAPRLLEPGIFKLWDGLANKREKYYDKMFDVVKSTKKTEYLQELSFFGLMEATAEGAPVKYEDMNQGVTTTTTNVEYKKGFIVTRAAMDDNQYFDVASKGTTALRFSCDHTYENVAALFYDNAFTGSGTGDGQALLSTAHPTMSGAQSNRLAVNAALSEAALEDLLILAKNTKNSKGLNMPLNGQSLIVASENMFEAHRILKSVNQSGTANNDINAIRSMGLLPGGVIVNPYLDNTDAFFVRTDVPAETGLVWFNRVAPEFSRDGDFDTDNVKYKVYARFTAVAGDWRALYGSDGA